MEKHKNDDLKVRWFDVDDECVQTLILSGRPTDRFVHQGEMPEYGRYVVIDSGTGELTVISER